MTTIKWIVNTENFRGSAHNMMSISNPDFVDLTNPPETFEEYNHKRGGNFKLVDDREFFEQWLKPFDNSLQGQWNLTSVDRFFEMLYILPPEKHRIIGDYETFFMEEYQTGTISSIYARHTQTNKCWTSLRDINIDINDLQQELTKL